MLSHSMPWLQSDLMAKVKGRGPPSTPTSVGKRRFPCGYVSLRCRQRSRATPSADYLTLDEALLTPEAFQFSDSDGDGKISSLEMADRRSFSVIDADRDEFVKFEENVKFLRIGPE